MRRFFFTIPLLFFVLTNLWSENYSQIEQITEDNILLRFHFDDINFPEKNIDGISYTEIEFPSLDFLTISESGNPQLPFLAETVGLPPGGDLSASVVSSSYEIFTNKYILCNPTYLDESENFKKIYSESSEIYEKNSYFPQKIIEVEIGGYVGDRLLGSVRIFPVQFNPIQKKVKIYTELLIKIHISGNKKADFPRGCENFLDNVADDIIINNQFSKSWRKERISTSSRKSRVDENIINKFKLTIDKKGIYKITHAFLKDSLAFWQDSLGIDYQIDFDIDSMDPRYLELTNRENPVPIYFYGEGDGSFDDDDYFEFYADINHGDDCFYDDYSQENCYWLEYNEGSFGSRMAVEDGGFYESSVYNPYYFDATLHFENQNLYKKLSQVEPVREDRWFWSEIIAPNLKNYSFVLHNPMPTQTRVATIRVALFGESYDNSQHNAIVWANDEQVGSAEWFNQTAQMISGTIPNDALEDGENNIFLDLPNSDEKLDKILFDYFDITFWKKYVCTNDLLEFKKPSYYGAGFFNFELKEFQTPDIDVYKIGVSKFENLRIELSPDETSYSVSLQDEIFADTIRYIALSDAQKLMPSKICPDIPSNLKSSDNLADYIVISKRDFLEDDTVNEFVNHWGEDEYGDLIVKPVALQDIFDEFNFGIRSAKAIKDFLKFAYNNWREPVLQYVLFLGDGCSDERDSSPKKKYNIVPTWQSWAFEIGATVDDNWFVCIVGDDELPDLSIGRLPIWEKSQIADVLQKTIQYNSNQNFDRFWRNHCVLIAGGGDEFSDYNEDLKNRYISNHYRVSRIYPNLGNADPYWGGTEELKDYIGDDGTALIQFIGHGGGGIWSDLNLLNLADISTLRPNDNCPIVISLACFTSNFESPQCKSLAEAFLIEPERGAIGFFGGAGKSHTNVVDEYSAYLFKNLFDRQMRTFSKIISLAKIEYSLEYSWGANSKAFTRSSNYLGDPAIDIVFPKNEIDLEMESYEFVLGDTVHFTVPENYDNVELGYYVTDENDLTEDLEQVEVRDIIETSYSENGFDHPIDTTQIDTVFQKIIRLYAYDTSTKKDYIGSAIFTVGKSAIFDIITIPEIPTLGDSVKISAKVYDKDGIDSVRCVWWLVPFLKNRIQMTSPEDDSSTFFTEFLIDAYNQEKTIYFQIEVVDNSTNLISSEEMKYQLKGADLEMQEFEFAINDSLPGFQFRIKNIGEIASGSFRVDVKKNDIVISSILINGLQNQEYIDTFFVHLFEPGEITLTVSANPDTSFLELNYGNNAISDTFSLNYFQIDPETSSSHYSLDSNLVVTFPQYVVADSNYFYINNVEVDNAEIQPDIEEISLKNDEFCSYEIGVFDSTKLDPNGNFNKDISLKFLYSKTDTLVQESEGERNFKIYRYDPEYKFWFLQGGYICTDGDSVVFDVSKPGIYSLFQNNDEVNPEIDVTVEEQEFTNGGYADDKAIFSFIFQDDNGINPEKITLILDGDTILTSGYSISTQNLHSVPAKYQIAVDVGSHNFWVSVTDVNGNFQEYSISFEVLKDFKIINIGNYPNPVISSTIDPNNSENTRFIYTLTDNADEVTIKIYTVSGRLVNQFSDLRTSVGYHEYPRAVKGWACTDFDGRKLANGVYFWKIIATKGNKTIEKINKMAILR